MFATVKKHIVNVLWQSDWMFSVFKESDSEDDNDEEEEATEHEQYQYIIQYVVLFYCACQNIGNLEITAIASFALF